ncbi:uncharacterized protein MONBRDRAFT_12483 [Monosiga brevicollis MX1]|uniref:Uncharacterized protein n=1 Tax=Monosiga brevicollis TaxID=81824 RepID=A9VCE6_MONBE|nr:uncharacterized protein MONBRDRAFT_12483 [Monosiga brevicollis MX1]EDQ84736.1 predicted protein [Monosiga brevicollis MX1]|eukprot:XP_001750386.1 hypothetical protein [Monosiga brevicollis MX1]
MARASLLWLLVVGVTVVAATGEPGITTNDGAMIIEADAVTVTTPNGDYTIGHADAQAEAAHERIDAVNASLKRAEQVAEESNLRLEATRADLQKVNASALANSAVNGQLASSVDALNASLEALVHSAGTTSQALSDRLDAVNASLKRAEETAEERNLRLEAIMADLQEVNASSLANSAVNGQLASSVDALNTSLEALVHSAAMTNQTLSNRLDAVNADIHALTNADSRSIDGIIFYCYNNVPAPATAYGVANRLENEYFTRTLCHVPAGYDSSSDTHDYTFTASDCRGVYPTGDCDGFLVRASQSGSDQDFQVWYRAR